MNVKLILIIEQNALGFDDSIEKISIENILRRKKKLIQDVI